MQQTTDNTDDQGINVPEKRPVDTREVKAPRDAIKNSNSPNSKNN